MDIKEFIETGISLCNTGIGLNEDDIKKAWEIVKAECECAHPDVNVLYSMARRIERSKAYIKESEATISTLNSVRKIVDKEVE